MSDYLKDLQDRAARLSSDWKDAENRAAKTGVLMGTPELLELRGRTADLRAEVEAEEKKTPESGTARNGSFDGLRMSDLTPEQRERLANPPADVPAQPSHEQMVRESRDAGTVSRASKTVKGEPNELLAPGVTMRQWVEAAAANGVSIQVGDASNGRMERVVTRDREFMNDYYGGITGVSQTRFNRAAVEEVRALGEGTAGSTISPISFNADVIDYLYANSILGKVGATRVPMAAQQVRVPQLTGVPSPTWIAENGSIGLDAGPAFSSLQLDASGGFKDITLVSLELAQDAYVSGGLTDYLAQQIAIRMALAVDAAAFYGIASNPGNPGFSNESGVQLRKYAAHTGATGATPTDPTELSVMAEIVRSANVEPTAFVCSPQFGGTISRLNASAYAKFWDIPADVTGQWSNRVMSTLVPVTETDTASGTVPVQTGGTYTSVYLADWSRLLLGVRLDMQVQTLRERYVDQGQIGLFAFGRYSTRLSHPEAAVRSYGVTVG